MKTIALFLAVLLSTALGACRTPGARTGPEAPISVRSLDVLNEAGRGRAIAYSGYRRDQSPQSGIRPSMEQVEEDLRILARNWRLIRLYKADRHAEDVLETIRREKLDLKVMLGLWLDREPGAERRNARQIARGIRMANRYDDIVIAVNVGNEVLVEWTEHPVPERQMIRYVRRVRERVPQPVTVADNYVWWRDEGAALAREVDFVTIHSYPVYERRDIDEGLSYTVENFEDVRDAIPDRTIVIGEAGWATYTDSNLNLPRAGDEQKQQRYYEELTSWARENGVTVFFFEAFDEPWKGTGTEGHWGLFTVDREAKPAMQALYPDRAPDGPTSPAYPDELVRRGPGLAVALRADFAETIPNGSVNPMGPGVHSSGVVTSRGAEGGTAFRLEFTGESWGGVYFFLDQYDARSAGAISMRLELPRDVTRLELKLEGPATNARSVNVLDHEGEKDEHGWRSFRIPLGAFDGVDLSRLVLVGLWNPQDRSGEYVPGEVLVDDVGFE